MIKKWYRYTLVVLLHFVVQIEHEIVSPKQTTLVSTLTILLVG